MTVAYLSGPMRGIPDQNVKAFAEAAYYLRDAGYTILNPSESFDGQRNIPRSECLRRDTQYVLVSDAVIALEGWQQSPGACFEVCLAWQIDIPVYEFRIVPMSSHGYRYELIPMDATNVVIPREASKQPLIGLCGYAGAGKDVFAAALVKRGWKRIAFADPLKAIATEIGWDGTKDEYGRRLLQNLGVAVRDFISPAAWVVLAENVIEQAESPVAISDVRFPNEVFMVKRRKGTLIRVVRPGNNAANEHVSEHAISDIRADATYVNEGPLDEVPERVEEFMDALGFPV